MRSTSLKSQLVLMALSLALVPLDARDTRADTLMLSSETRLVQIDIDHTEDFYSSCIPLPPSPCMPDSSTTTHFSDSATAPDAAPWTATASLIQFPNTSATQDSEIGATFIQATGSHTAVSSYSNTGGFPITFISENHATETSLVVTFDLAADCAFDLSGSVTTEGGIFSTSSTYIRLSVAGGGVIAEVQVDSAEGCADPECLVVGPAPIATSGVLAAGTYTLEAFAGGIATGVHSTIGSFGSGEGGAFEVNLVLAPQPVPTLSVYGAVFLAMSLLVLTAVIADRNSKRSIHRREVGIMSIRSGDDPVR